MTENKSTGGTENKGDKKLQKIQQNGTLKTIRLLRKFLLQEPHKLIGNFQTFLWKFSEIVGHTT